VAGQPTPNCPALLQPQRLYFIYAGATIAVIRVFGND